MIPLGMLAGSRHVPSGGGGTFSPTEVAGLDLWLSAANLTGLSSGDPVATWPDDSGANNHATQASSSAQPLYSTAAGVPSVWFDGTSNHYLTTPVSAAGTAHTTFAVVTVEDDAVRTPVGASGTVGFVLEFTSARRVNARSWGSSGSAVQLFPDAPPVSTKAVIGGLYDAALGESRSWADRSDERVGTTSPLTAGRVIHIGIKATSAERHYGHIFEVLHYSAALSPEDRAAVQSYLLNKHGI